MSNSINNTAGVIAQPPLIFAIFLAVGLILHFIYPIDFWYAAWPVLKYIGALMLAVSATLALWSSKVMRRENTPINPNRPTSTIVTDGPFRLTRNPLYVSLLLLYGGIALLVNSLWLIVMTVAMFLAFDIGVVRREERYLKQKFGDEYLQYKSRVRRWI